MVRLLTRRNTREVTQANLLREHATAREPSPRVDAPPAASRHPAEAEQLFVDALTTSQYVDEIAARFSSASTRTHQSARSTAAATSTDFVEQPRKRRAPALLAAALRRRLAGRTHTDDDDSFAGIEVVRVAEEEELTASCSETVIAEEVVTTHARAEAHLVADSTSETSSVASTAALARRSRYARMATRARQAIRALTDVPLSNTHTSGLTSKSVAASFAEPLSIHLSRINGEDVVVVSRVPKAEDFSDDLQRMRNPFPNVPNFQGNPPWLTRFHPDLVKPPASFSTRA